jgi:hypothetical protein
MKFERLTRSEPSFSLLHNQGGAASKSALLLKTRLTSLSIGSFLWNQSVGYGTYYPRSILFVFARFSRKLTRYVDYQSEVASGSLGSFRPEISCPRAFEAKQHLPVEERILFESDDRESFLRERASIVRKSPDVLKSARGLAVLFFCLSVQFN